MRSLFLVNLAVLTVLVSSVAAIAESDGVTPQESVWDEDDRVVREDLVVANDTTLIIRGITVAFNGSDLTVESRGRLVIESLPGAPAALTRDGAWRWSADVKGSVEILGLSDAPVRVEGFGDLGGTSRSTVAYQNGFSVTRGRLTVQHADFSDFSSGFLISLGEAEFRHVNMKSLTGSSIITTGGALRVEDARFEGEGSGLFLTNLPTPALLRNVTVEDAATGVTVRKSHAILENVHFARTGVCVYVLGGTLQVRDVSCTDFKEAGIAAETLTIRDVKHYTNVSLIGVTASGIANSKAAISADEATTFSVADAMIGPVGGHGIYAKRNLPTLANLTFREVGGYDVLVESPPSDPAPYALKGESGGLGWQIVTRPVTVKVVDAVGEPVDGARVRFLADGVLLKEIKATRLGFARYTAEVFRVDTDNRTVQPALTAHASRDGLGSVEVALVPAQLVEARLQGEVAKAIPGPSGFMFVVVVFAAVQVLRRR